MNKATNYKQPIVAVTRDFWKGGELVLKEARARRVDDVDDYATLTRALKVVTNERKRAVKQAKIWAKGY